ncbi:MAG TPA: pyridoxamine 5'-phosphate oxidase family protein [Micromonosporaceae bacterium]|jgi:PPOX class probable F420-dependent enzyme
MTPTVLSDDQVAFLQANHTAVMATVDDNGYPHVVPVGCALIDGQLWSSGREDRVRTGHLRRRPHATMTVQPIRTPEHPGHNPRRRPGHRGEWVSVHGPVTIKADDPAGDNIRLHLEIVGHLPDDIDEYAATMLRERRLVYILTPIRAYGPSWRRRTVTPDRDHAPSETHHQ